MERILMYSILLSELHYTLQLGLDFLKIVEKLLKGADATLKDEWGDTS